MRKNKEIKPFSNGAKMQPKMQKRRLKKNVRRRAGTALCAVLHIFGHIGAQLIKLPKNNDIDSKNIA